MMIFDLCAMFVVGACLGSFLNVCIVRMPQEKSIVFPGSHCVKCQKPILWYDNIPIISFIFLRGKCRFCDQKISIRYPIVEILTALMFVAFTVYFGMRWILMPYLVMLCGLIIATFVDIEHRIIPDEVSVGGLVVGLIFSGILPEIHDTSSHLLGLWRSLLGVLIGGGFICLTGVIGDFIFKKESMGGGDIKLLGMIGSFIGWKAALLSFFLACFFGALLGIVVKIRTKESLIPFGPCLVMGALICLFWSEPMIRWILVQYGIN